MREHQCPTVGIQSQRMGLIVWVLQAYLVISLYPLAAQKKDS